MTWETFISDNRDYLFAFLAFLVFLSLSKFLIIIGKSLFAIWKDRRL